MSRFYFSTNYGAQWFSTRCHNLRSIKKVAVNHGTADINTPIFIGVLKGEKIVTTHAGQPGKVRRTWREVVQAVTQGTNKT
jgi:hypothetical protein